MILLLQVLLKNRLVSPAAFNKFVEISREYGIDDLKIPYADLKPIFADPKKYLYSKYGLEKLLPVEVSKEFDLLFPKPKSVPKPVPPPVVPPVVKEEVKPKPVEVKPKPVVKKVEVKPEEYKKPEVKVKPKVGAKNRG